jgi:hypothetical protein
MSNNRPLPKPGQKIHCDPNRDDGDTPGRWRNPNRKSAKVIAVLNDDGVRVIVFRWHSKRRGWVYQAEDELWWNTLTSWQIGPLPRPPK